jgi:hypothetical protein
MSRMFVYSFACAVMGSSLALFSAQAFPISSLDSHLGPSDVTFVAGGCGIGFHRGPYGGCRPNRRPVVVVPGAPVVLAPPVVCGAGFRWHPRFRRCVVL